MGQEIENMHRWQQEIKKRLWEAEAGDFASEEEVRAVFANLANSNVTSLRVHLEEKMVNFCNIGYLCLSNIVRIEPTGEATVPRC